MLFSSIIGQDAVKNRLIQTVKEQRIPHAQLFSGGVGVGKRALALAYAQYICCQDRGENDSCGKCPSCLKFAKLVHPDMHFVFPVIKPSNKTTVVCDDFIAPFRSSLIENPYFSEDEWFEKIAGEGKKGLIYSNESQEILRKLNLKTYESEYKIMLIWQAEKMHEQCANKLLKIIEEPPPKTLFLLLSDASDTIISTIQSRVQRINIPPIAVQDLANALFERFDLPITDSQCLARLVNGNFSKATQELAANESNQMHLENFMQLMRTAYGIKFHKKISEKGNSLQALKIFSGNMAKIGRENQKRFLVYSQHMIRENFIYNLKRQELNYLSKTEREFADKFAPFINESNVISIMHELGLAEQHIDQNVQARFVFYDLALKLIMLLKN